MNCLCSINTHAFHKVNTAVANVYAIPSTVSANGLPTLHYPFWNDVLDYATNTGTGGSDGTLNSSIYSTTRSYKSGITGSLCTNNSYFRLPDLPAGYGSANGFTMCGWFYLPSASSTLWSNANGNGRVKLFSQGTSTFLAYVTSMGTNTTVTSSVNTWEFVVYKAQPLGGSVMLSINNGTVATVGTWTVATTATNSSFNNIGADSPTDASLIYVNNFYLFPRLLTTAEITALYNQ